VIEVPIKPNESIKKGEVLFKLDPEPFQYKVDAIEARLRAAKIDKDRAKELMVRGIGKQRDLVQTTALVDQLTAELSVANYNLSETVILAPTDGLGSHLILRPGMMAVPMPLRPVMVFIHKEENYYVGWYLQNSTLRLKEGYEAEVAFDSVPGKVFAGKVVEVLPVLAQGEMQARGNLLSSDTERFPGRVPVIIKITDERFNEFKDQVPGGAFGPSALHSDHVHHVAIMRKILIRMSSWMSYLFPFH